MFEIEENRYMKDNSCKYTDEHGNRAYMQLRKDKIVAKLRFSNPNIKADVMYIDFPPKDDEEGKDIHVNYKNKNVLNEKSVNDAFKNFTQLINYWIHMVSDIRLLQADISILMSANPDKTIEEINQYRLSKLSLYNEINNYIC